MCAAVLWRCHEAETVTGGRMECSRSCVSGCTCSEAERFLPRVRREMNGAVRHKADRSRTVFTALEANSALK